MLGEKETEGKWYDEYEYNGCLETEIWAYNDMFILSSYGKMGRLFDGSR